MGHYRADGYSAVLSAAAGGLLIAAGLALYVWGLRQPAGAGGGLPLGYAVVGSMAASTGATHLAARTALAWRPRRPNAEVGLAAGLFFILLVAWAAAYPPAAERVGVWPLALAGALAVATVVASVWRLTGPLVDVVP